MIEETGFYLQATGQIIKIVEIDTNSTYIDNCYDMMYTQYYPNGSYEGCNAGERDLIAHIPPALHFEILRVIEAYHTQDSFKSIIDTCYKNHLEKKKEN